MKDIVLTLSESMAKVLISDDSRIVELQNELAQTNLRLSNVESKLDQVLQRLSPIQQVRLTSLEGKLDRILTHLSPIQQLRLCTLESKLDQVFRHVIRLTVDRVPFRHESLSDGATTTPNTTTTTNNGEVPAAPAVGKVILQNSNQSSSTARCYDGTPPTKHRSYCYDRSAVNLMKYEWLSSSNNSTTPPTTSRLDSRPSTPIDQAGSTQTQNQTQEESTRVGHSSTMFYYGSEISQPNSPALSHDSRPSSSLSTVQFCQKSSLTRGQTVHHYSSHQHGSNQSSPQFDNQDRSNTRQQYTSIQTVSLYVKQRLDSGYLSGRDRQELRILLQLSQFENMLSITLKKDVLSRLQMFSAVVTHGWSAASRITERQSAILHDMTRRMQDIQVTTAENRFKISRFHKLALKSSRKKKH